MEINLSYEATYLQPDKRYLIEDICSKYVGSIDSALLKIAIFNVLWMAILHPLFSRFKDKVLLKISGYEFTIADLDKIGENVFIMLNVFFFGYYLLIRYLPQLQDLKVIGWLFR